MIARSFLFMNNWPKTDECLRLMIDFGFNQLENRLDLRYTVQIHRISLMYRKEHQGPCEVHLVLWLQGQSQNDQKRAKLKDQIERKSCPSGELIQTFKRKHCSGLTEYNQLQQSLKGMIGLGSFKKRVKLVVLQLFNSSGGISMSLTTLFEYMH